MALTLQQKKELVAELAEVAGQAHSLVAAEYAGLTVAQMTDLRRKARDGGVFLKVSKNTLVRRAVENTDFACVADALTGPMIYAFSTQDPGAAGRLIKGFSKTHDKLKARLVSMSGRMYPASHVDVLASLPTRVVGGHIHSRIMLQALFSRRQFQGLIAPQGGNGLQGRFPGAPQGILVTRINHHLQHLGVRRVFEKLQPLLRGFLLFVVPIGFVIYLPSLYLLEKPDPLGLPGVAPFLAPVAAVGFAMVTGALWRLGVRHYRSTGS